MTNQKFAQDETHFHNEVNNTTPLTNQMDKVSSILEYLQSNSPRVPNTNYGKNHPAFMPQNRTGTLASNRRYSNTKRIDESELTFEAKAFTKMHADRTLKTSKGSISKPIKLSKVQLRRMRELGVVFENGKLSQQDIPGLPYSQAQTYKHQQYLPPMEKHNPGFPIKS